MVSWIAMLFAAFASLITVWASRAAWVHAKERIRRFTREVDVQTAGDPAEPPAESDEIESLIFEALQEKDGASATLATHELESQAKLYRVQVRSVARAAGRIPLLAAVASALTIVALDGFEGTPLYWALGCALLGLLGASASQIFARLAVRSTSKFSDLSSELARRVEAHWGRLGKSRGSQMS